MIAHDAGLRNATLSAPATRRKYLSFGAALGVELLLLAVFLAWSTTTVVRPASQVIALSIESLAEPEKPELVKPEKIAAVLPPPAMVSHAVKAATPVAAPRVVPAAAPQAPAAVQPEVVPLAAAPEAAPAPVSVTAAAPPSISPPPAPAPAAVSAPTSDPAPAYNARIAAAVQAAFQLPAAASAMGFKGKVRVEFVLHEGHPGAVRTLLSSGFGAVDRAAILAVQSAIYPAPPAALERKETAYQIWVACF